MMFLLVACGPYVGAPSRPGDATLIHWQVGVDPVDEGLWVGLDETDPAVVQAYVDAMEAAESDEERDAAYAAYQANSVLRVIHLDGGDYRDQTVETLSGTAVPVVRFTSAGAVLSAGIRHDLYDRDLRWAAGAERGTLEVSPQDGWVMHRVDGDVSLLPADLSEATPLEHTGPITFTPDDHLLARVGPWSLQTLAPDTLVERARWSLPADLRGRSEQWAVRPDGGQVIVQVSDGPSRSLVALDTASGDAVALTGLGWGRYNHDGSAYYQTAAGQVRILDTETLVLTTVDLDGRYGAWLDDTGRWLVVETEDYDLGLVDLEGSGVLAALDDEGLGAFVVRGETLWTTGADGLRVIHLADRWVEVVDPGCVALSLAIQPAADRVVVRCNDQTDDVIVLDPDTRAQIARVSLD